MPEIHSSELNKSVVENELSEPLQSFEMKVDEPRVNRLLLQRLQMTFTKISMGNTLYFMATVDNQIP